jgi:aryl-alcohol dehydrogenase-like predicted oxidoreductase
MNDSVKRCLDYGINLFDTAELYGFGDAEVSLGLAFKEVGAKREELVVITKLFFGNATDRKTSVAEQFQYYKEMGGINQTGLSRKHIIEGTRTSLSRLQLDYVDVIFGHRPDVFTPLEETCRAFSWVID